MQYLTLALTLLASIIPALSIAVGEADPAQLFARADAAIGSNLCKAPIVNLYAYSNANCTTGYLQGIPEQRNSPIPFQTKFAPFNSKGAQKFQSKCKDTAVLTVNGEPAKSLAFSADGALTEYCKVQVFLAKGCAGKAAKSFNLDGFGKGSGVGLCEAVGWRSARVVCDQSEKNN